MTDWIIRVEGVNLGTTVLNTNDLSLTRGASLTLEAFGYELEERLEDLGYTFAGEEQVATGSVAPRQIGFVYRASAQAALLLSDFARNDAKHVKAQVQEILCASKDQAYSEPPLVAFSDVKAMETGEAIEVPFFETPPTEHLTFVVDLVEVIGSVRAAVNKGLMMNRRQQMRTPNLPVSIPAYAPGVDPSLLQCPIDPAQQIHVDDANGVPTLTEPDLYVSGQSTLIVNEERYTEAVEVDPFEVDGEVMHGPRKLISVSKRSADLATFGRDARQHVCKKILEPDDVNELQKAGFFQDFAFAQSFHDIVDNPPPFTPVGLQSKLAYFYVDGNGFGSRRANCDLTAFARFSKKTMSFFTRELISYFMAQEEGGLRSRKVLTDGSAFIRSGAGRLNGEFEKRDVIRMETLMSAGDEFAIVVPAWLAFDIAPKLMTWLEEGTNAARNEMPSWVEKDVFSAPFSYRAGLVICDKKCPARKARSLAYALCDDAKIGRPKDAWALSFWITEGFDVPDIDGSTPEALAAMRGMRFTRTAGRGEDLLSVADAFRENGGTYSDTELNIRTLKSYFAKSKLHQVINFVEGNPEDDAYSSARKAFAKYGYRGPSGITLDDIFSLLPGSRTSPLHLRLKVAAEIWDYIDPFRDDLNEEASK